MLVQPRVNWFCVLIVFCFLGAGARGPKGSPGEQATVDLGQSAPYCAQSFEHGRSKR